MIMPFLTNLSHAIGMMMGVHAPCVRITDMTIFAERSFVILVAPSGDVALEHFPVCLGLARTRAALAQAAAAGRGSRLWRPNLGRSGLVRYKFRLCQGAADQQGANEYGARFHKSSSSLSVRSGKTVNCFPLL